MTSGIEKTADGGAGTAVTAAEHSRPRAIDVWRIALAPAADWAADWTTTYSALLSAGERARAERFRFTEHRRRFIVAHAAVRFILAQRTGIAPAELQFARTPHGKPYLTSPGGPVFSLSHSHEMALCAVAEDGELGVDIEWRRELPHAELARRFFAPSECQTLAALDGDERLEGFFACWTRKEAYIKAKGLGLALPLRTFAVTAHPRQAPALLASADENADVGRYRLWEIAVSSGYRAALAYCGAASAAPRCLDWRFPPP